MDISQNVYIKFYNILKNRFLNRIPEEHRVDIANQEFSFWYTAIPGTRNDTYFSKFFGIHATSPRHFYLKYLEAGKADTVSIFEKDALLIHVFKSFFGLCLPPEVNESEISFGLKAQLYFQTFFEMYEPGMFSIHPDLYVYSRILETWREKDGNDLFPIGFHDTMAELSVKKRNTTDVRKVKRNLMRTLLVLSDVIKFKEHIRGLELWVPSEFCQKVAKYFFNEHLSTSVIELQQVFDIEIDGDFRGSNVAHCKALFFEVMTIRRNNALLEIGKYDVAFIDTYIEKLRDIFHSAGYGGWVDEDWKFSVAINDIFDLPGYEAIQSQSNKPLKDIALLPDKKFTGTYRFYEFTFEKINGDWRLSNYAKIFTNSIRRSEMMTEKDLLYFPF